MPEAGEQGLVCGTGVGDAGVLQNLAKGCKDGSMFDLTTALAAGLLSFPGAMDDESVLAFLTVSLCIPCPLLVINRRSR